MVLARIKHLLKCKHLKVDDLAVLTNTPYSRWSNVLSGKAKIRHAEIEALGNIYPEHKLWIAFGDTLPKSGQISPTPAPYKKS